MDTQKIYSWIPLTRELKLLLDEGPGTINSVEFDDHANNLYWVDVRNFAVKVMNMESLKKIIVLQGESAYAPVDLALHPING